MGPDAARILRDAATIFVAACALGAAFNSASPLGVRATASADRHTAAPAPVIPSGIYSNQTLSINAQPAPVVRGSGIENETLSVVISQSATPPVALVTPPVAAAALAVKQLPTVTWPQTKALLARNAAILVDARDAASFEAGHIPGAISLPTAAFGDRISDFAAKVPQDKTIVVYCASAKCSLSRNLAQLLMERHGYRDVRDMPGGYAEWRIVESNAPTAANSR